MEALFCFPKEMVRKDNRKEINFPIEIESEGRFTQQNILFPYRKGEAIGILFCEF